MYISEWDGRVIHGKEIPSEARVAMLRLLSFGADQDDIVLILHMDRKDHLVMNYAQGFDRLPIGEQENLALLVGTNNKIFYLREFPPTISF